MTELEELIQFWKDYLVSRFEGSPSLYQIMIKHTITYLEKLNEIQKGD